jgi:pyruvate-formate lyase-activating enzyme
VPHCPHEALHIQAGRVWWQEHECQQCDTCLHLCPQQATPMAQRYSVMEIVEQVRKVAPFIEGITVSGGEATTQLPFVIALFTAIKSDPALGHLTCLVDSNGLLSETGWQKLLPVLDGAMLDLKAWDLFPFSLRHPTRGRNLMWFQRLITSLLPYWLRYCVF